MAYIDLRGVSKSFPVEDDEIRALASVSLGIEQGEFVSLVGPSGCGKSTLLRIVAGLSRPDEGEVLVAGRTVVRPRDDVGIVFQRPVLLPWRRVLGNILLPVEVAGTRGGGHRAYAQELIELVGLRGFADRYPAQLSGGMQQRVAICRALMLEPKILLMDEPFGALDAITRDQMGVELLRIWSQVGATVLFITHSIPEAVLLSDRIAIMSQRPGRIVDVVPVPLARPRSLSVMGSPEFGRLSARIRDLVETGAAVSA